MKKSHLLILARLLYDSAIDFEYAGGDSSLYDGIEQDIYDNAGAYLVIFARLPYDATYSLQALLDCLNFMMQHHLMEERCLIDVVQLGFGFAESGARLRWVTTMENLLYNFNVQCKFMMPCKHRPPAIRYVARFSNQRGPLKDTFMPFQAVYSPSNPELDKQWLRILFRYFSMGESIDTYGAKNMKQAPTELEELAYWQELLSELRNNFNLFSIQPDSVPVTEMDTVASSKRPPITLDLSMVGPKAPRLVPFVASLMYANPKFACLTRYYILNCVTGAHGLFIFQQEPKVAENFFARNDHNPKFKRKDLMAYVQHYINYAHDQIGRPKSTAFYR